MDTRLNKYNENNGMSRVAKHEDLYKEINNSELDNFSVKSNATVIGSQEQEIDIEKIKKILDKKYNEAPKRRSIRIEPRVEEDIVNEEPTKEYDLNMVLERAKDEKPESYEENRAKKLRNTQYDILSNLNLEDEEIEEVEEKEEKSIKSGQDELMELINTISINETKLEEIKKVAQNDDNETDPLDILEDLRGSENTQVYEGINEQIKEAIEEEKTTEKPNSDNKKDGIDNSFYTNNLFKKKDFVDDDNKDFVDNDKLSIGIKILIVLVIVSFLVGIFLFLKSFLNF